MNTNKKTRKGFSLVEVMIAIGIVAILLTTFMTVFGPAQQSINRSIGISDANRLVATLENEMAILRTGEETKYQDGDGNASAFEKAFQWIKDSDQKTDAIIVYQYLAYPNEVNKDNTLEAITTKDAQGDSFLPGKDYITQTVARRLSHDPDGQIPKELTPGVVSGNVYVARFTQLVKNATTGGLELGTEGEIVSIDEKGAEKKASNSTNYEEAYITAQVEFFQLPTNIAGYVTGGAWDFSSLGAPVAVQNIAVRR
jgi:prepilin-type N-terminal cleavage/methylation domain-containing protein